MGASDGTLGGRKAGTSIQAKEELSKPKTQSEEAITASTEEGSKSGNGRGCRDHSLQYFKTVHRRDEINTIRKRGLTKTRHRVGDNASERHPGS